MNLPPDGTPCPLCDSTLTIGIRRAAIPRLHCNHCGAEIPPGFRPATATNHSAMNQNTSWARPAPSELTPAYATAQRALTATEAEARACAEPKPAPIHVALDEAQRAARAVLELVSILEKRLDCVLDPTPVNDAIGADIAKPATTMLDHLVLHKRALETACIQLDSLTKRLLV